MGMSVYNTPAPHAAKLASKSFARMLWFFAGAGAALAFGYILVPSLWIFWGAGIVVLGAFALKAKDDWGKARIGVKSETKVAKALEKSNAAQVLVNSAMLGAGGDADHVLLGPVVAVVETKTGFNKIRVKDGRVYSGSKEIAKGAVKQVNRQGDRLSQVLGGVPVQRVVCVADGKGKPFQASGVWFCNAESVSEVVRYGPSVLSNDRLGPAVNTVLAVHQRNERD